MFLFSFINVFNNRLFYLSMQNSNITKTIYSVSKLTAEIKMVLEEKYPFIWINGEISNLAKPSSGHVYFTLKDKKAQISSVMFRGQCRNLKFDLQNGLNITGFGRISLYEPRGSYQFIFEFIEPKGAGALQLAFEQLKEKLSTEGLFDERHKKKLPFLPKRIGVITSSTGAVIHDIKNVVNRRFSNTTIEIAPVNVQGVNSENEIASAIALLNTRALSDVIIIARGGGSLEDLASFNSEIVARAVFASEIPVVSAVGHETDYTICDFVADLRAPTPSAAAEIVVPDKQALKLRLSKIQTMLISGFKNNISYKKSALESISTRLVNPKRRIHDLQFLIEDYRQRIIRTIQDKIQLKRNNLNWKIEKLKICSPLQKSRFLQNSLKHQNERLTSAIYSSVHHNRLRLKELNSRLKSLSPVAVIERGYSITRTIPKGEIITNSKKVEVNQEIEVILAKGSIICSVEGVE